VVSSDIPHVIYSSALRRKVRENGSTFLLLTEYPNYAKAVALFPCHLLCRNKDPTYKTTLEVEEENMDYVSDLLLLFNVFYAN
jgi:hypothetical protein